ncbi:predicted protein [Aspergillus terreus NIH2624]|uniref:Cytochrome P450 n=1 Tax=Aspergillus terreus (strain NIH 2624 / FGSC A1156) TaxID=341663 RepID=Q0CS77_ASPTN|nr:uncharacterized protein ATEG_03457 [Aspergillus terreus NIH2624]EAU36731.1 predicted protein [Aspergillus terreus NIH2624]
MVITLPVRASQSPSQREIVWYILSCLFAWLLYKFSLLCLPTPFHDIPHNEGTTRTIFGDLASMLSEVSKSNDIFTWLLRQTQKANSPLYQVFIRPFGRPSILLSDYWEATDIVLHRSREFDRTPYTADVFSGVLPNHHIHMPTGPEWKAHRRLLQDLMTPNFLNNTAAPAIYDRALELVDLWDAKARLAAGRPFFAAEDIHNTALDAVLSFSFGGAFPHSATRPQLELLSTLYMEAVHRNDTPLDRPAEFPQASPPDCIKAILDITGAFEYTKSSIFPRLMWFLASKTPRVRHAVRTKDNFVLRELQGATHRLVWKDSDADHTWAQSAVDLIVDRERKYAEREGRSPNFFGSAIRDEVFGFVLAGHDTTSTTIAWGIKLLADNPDAQTNLRLALKNALLEAAASNRLPLCSEVIRTSIPYLDATIEEILRCAPTVPAVDRVALNDTVLLGHSIPKGTSIFLMNKGASFFSPPHEIEDEKRSPSARAAKNKGHHAWDPETLDIFLPERWLVASEEQASAVGTANVVFDPAAGPAMPFGGGPRGCWGRRLAYLEMRLIFALMVWRFELLGCPKELSGYDAFDGLVHKPKDCFVRLKRIES